MIAPAETLPVLSSLTVHVCLNEQGALLTDIIELPVYGVIKSDEDCGCVGVCSGELCSRQTDGMSEFIEMWVVSIEHHQSL